MILLLQYTLTFASVLILVALGGCFSEHSGVINLGLEGVMIMGALGGALAMRYMPGGSSHFAMLLVVLLAAALMGMILFQPPGRGLHQLQGRPDHCRYGAEYAGHRRGNGYRKGHQHGGQPR